ncbi:MAG: Phosphoserine aminotransferase, partial [uncultured Solirubrobacteraceae bacterium]
APREPARVDERRRRPRLLRRAHHRVLRRPLRLGGGLVLRDAVRRRPGQALARDRHDRLRRGNRRRRAGLHAARERDRRRRAVPQARAQPAARGDVPGDRAGRRRGAHRLHRLDRRADRGGRM